MSYQLLVDLKAIGVLDAMHSRTRTRLLHHLEHLQLFPERYADYQERDDMGRRVDVSVFAGYCIQYWIDHADQHIKVLALVPADT